MGNTRIRWLICSLWCVTTALCIGQSNVPFSDVNSVGLEAQIDAIAQESIADRAFPGVQVMVYYQGRILLQKCYGYHTYDSIRPVMTSDIYDLASITKVTSVLPALMQLVGEGVFDLDKTVADYFPEFRRSNKADLVWRDILAHNARLQPWIPYWRSTIKKNGKYKRKTFKQTQSKKYSIEVTDSLFLHRDYKKKIYRAIKETPLNDEPGYVYSGLAFYILPEIIERITGQPLDVYLRENVYDPIGAETLGYRPLGKYPEDRIVPTERDTFFRMTQIHGRVHDEGAAMMNGVSGNAGLFATAGDLGKLALLYYDRGVLGKDTIIEPMVVDEFTRCQFCEMGNRRGLGFDKPVWYADPEGTSVTYCREASADSYGHSGYTGTLMWIDPDSEMIFLFFSNRVYPTRLNTLINENLVRPRMHQAIYDSIEAIR